MGTLKRSGSQFQKSDLFHMLIFLIRLFVPVKETAHWILDHPDSGLLQRMGLGKSKLKQVKDKHLTAIYSLVVLNSQEDNEAQLRMFSLCKSYH